jgi:hypothetical protein
MANGKTLQQLIAAAQNTTSIMFTNDVLSKAAEKAAQAANEKAVGVAQTVLGVFQAHLQTKVLYLRQARESVKAYEKAVAEVDRAFRYFADTANPLPMFKVMGYNATSSQVTNFFSPLGVPVPASDDDAWTIPAGWTAPKDEEPTTADAA